MALLMHEFIDLTIVFRLVLHDSRRDMEIERPIVGLNEDTVNTLT